MVPLLRENFKDLQDPDCVPVRSIEVLFFEI